MCRRVAIKVFLPQAANQLGEVGVKNPTARLLKEAQIASTLRHNNLCTVYVAGLATDKRLYIVMEFLEGTPLSNLCTDNPQEIIKTLDVVCGVCDALSYLHKKGLVHRDIKPSNVVVCTGADGKPLAKLIDLGLARSVTSTQASTLTLAGALIGTVGYMSPEQCLGKPADARSDIFSVGVLLYECLTGKVPFLATNAHSFMFLCVNTEQPSFAEREPAVSIPRQLEDITFKAMAKNPAKRYQSIEEMREEIFSVRTALSQGLPITEVSPRPVASAHPLASSSGRKSLMGWNKQHWFKSTCAGLTLVVAVAGLVYCIKSRDSLQRRTQQSQLSPGSALERDATLSFAAHKNKFEASLREYRRTHSPEARVESLQELKECCRLQSTQPAAINSIDLALLLVAKQALDIEPAKRAADVIEVWLLITQSPNLPRNDRARQQIIIHQFDECIDQARTTENAAPFLEDLAQRAGQFVLKIDAQTASKYLEVAIAAGTKTNSNETVRAVAYEELGEAYGLLRRPKESEENYSRAMALAEECIHQGDWFPLQRAECLSVTCEGLGRHFGDKGQDQIALTWYLKGLNAAHHCQSIHGEETVSNAISIAECYRHLGDQQNARKYFHQADAYLPQVRSSPKRFRLEFRLATLVDAPKEREKRLIENIAAMKSYSGQRPEGMTYTECATRAELANTYLDSGQTQKALTFLDEALNYRAGNKDFFVAQVAYRMANVLKNQHDRAGALKYYKYVCAMCDSKDRPSTFGVASYLAAAELLENDDPSATRRYIQRAAEWLKQLPDNAENRALTLTMHKLKGSRG